MMLQGEKVVLRPLQREDLPKLCQFNNDIAVELAGGGDPPLPQSLARLQASFEQRLGEGERDGLSFAIEADEKFIGICAAFGIDEVARTSEMGITIGDKGYWGKGYGRDAVLLLVDYLFRHHNMHKVHLRVHGRNERAIRAYRACGFVEEGRQRAHVWSDGGYDDLVRMGILQAERHGLPKSSN